MRRRWRAVALLVAFAAGRVSADELLSDGHVLQIFKDILRRGSFGLRDEEAAAFVIRKKDGSYACLLWPATAEFRKARYRQPIPRGAVAIVHTHPFSIPWPSPQDRQTARALRIPIYALTLANVYKADIDGQSIALVYRERWGGAQASMPVCSLNDDPLPFPQPPSNLDLMEVCGRRLAVMSGGGDRGCEW
jgi:hypothetical protein